MGEHVGFTPGSVLKALHVSYEVLNVLDKRFSGKFHRAIVHLLSARKNALQKKNKCCVLERQRKIIVFGGAIFTQMFLETCTIVKRVIISTNSDY